MPVIETMTPESVSLVAKWINALRSGVYEQTTGSLRRGDEGDHAYCCLGVACDVSKMGDWSTFDVFEIDAALIGHAPVPGTKASSTQLPLALARKMSSGDFQLDPLGSFKYRWDGREGDEPWPNDHRDRVIGAIENLEESERALTSLNDSEAVSFEDIAWLVEDAIISDDPLVWFYVDD